MAEEENTNTTETPPEALAEMAKPESADTVSSWWSAPVTRNVTLAERW
jgi:hypothetical protein